MNKIVLSLKTSRSGTLAVGFKDYFEDVEINVGDGVTLCYYSDRVPATIIDIADNGAWIKVQEDGYRRIDSYGMSDCQEYECSRNSDGRIHTFKRTRKDKNTYTDNGVYRYPDYGIKLAFGFRMRYFDFSY